MTRTTLRRGRAAVNARIFRTQALPNPMLALPDRPVARVTVKVPDGFGDEVEISAEACSGRATHSDPHLALRLKFAQQHFAELHDRDGNCLSPDCYAGYQPTVTLYAWGYEASELPNVLRAAADAAEAALQAQQAHEANHSNMRKGAAA